MGESGPSGRDGADGNRGQCVYVLVTHLFVLNLHS